MAGCGHLYGTQSAQTLCGFDEVGQVMLCDLGWVRDIDPWYENRSVRLRNGVGNLLEFNEMNHLVHALVSLAKRAPRGGFPVVSFLARHSASLRAYPVRLSLLPGIELKADLRESVWYPLFKYGCYPHQIAEDRLALGFLRPGDCVWDIGANIGYTALLYAHAVGRSGFVVAVEPSRRAFPMLIRSIAEVAQIVHPIHAAVSENSGEIDFSDAEMLDTSAVTDGGSGAYRVPSITLDSLLERQPDRAPDFLKIDVEGHELSALRGASRVIGTHKPPLIQFEALSESARATTIALLSASSAGAYRYYRIRHDGQLAPHDAVAGPEMTNNYLAAGAMHATRGIPPTR